MQYIKNISIIFYIIIIVALFMPIKAQNWKEVDSTHQELQKRYQMAAQLEKNGRIDDALEIYKYLHKQKPKKSTYLKSYIRLLYKKSKFEEMASVLESYLKRKDSDQSAWLNLGEAYYKMGKKESAYQQWNEFLDNFEHSEMVYRKLFMQYVRLKEYEKSEDLVKKFRERYDNDQLMALELGQLYRNQAKYQEALHEFLKYARHRGQYDHITRNLLKFPDNKSTFDQIENYLKNEIPSNTKNTNLLEIKAKLYFKYKQYERAIETTMNIEQAHNYSGQHIKKLCENLIKEKEFAEAESTYYRILKNQNLNSIHHQAFLGIANIAEKKIEDRKTNIFNYFYPNNYFFKSIYYYGIDSDLKYLEEAFSIYDTLLHQNQKAQFSAEVNYRLGNLSLVGARDFDAALKFFRTAYKQAGNYDFRIKCTSKLAHTYLARGEKQEALAEIEKIFPRVNTKYKKKLYPDLLLFEFYNNHKNIDSLANQALNKLDFQEKQYNDILEFYIFVQKIKDAKGYQDFIQGEIELRQDKLAKARNTYNYIVNNYSSAVYEPALFRSIQLELYFKNYQKAEKLVSKMDSTSIYRGDVIYMLAEVAKDQKQDSKMAKHWYQELVVNYPNDINVEKARKTLRKLSEN
ncbi:MAG: tetratricopeptide repeat protein [Candidatus Marinimicrobia bacterium]|nr:tetratricopeptide repeat protein [Candidatus Neomarinimicrobiota bacterium]